MQQILSGDGSFRNSGTDWCAVAKAVSIVLAAMGLLLIVSLFYPMYGM